MGLTDALEERVRYEDHIVYCRGCRVALSAILNPDAKAPDDLCRQGQRLWWLLAVATFRRAMTSLT